MTEVLGLELVPALDTSGVEWSATHLQVLDPNLSFETFEQLVAAAGVLGDAGRWILGDLQVFGEARYGEQYAQVLASARVGERSLRRYRYVALQIPRGRRWPNLSFSHHDAVARLEPVQQDRLLRRALDEAISSDELLELTRDLVALDRPRPAPRQEVLGAPEVDAVRNLSQARETLVDLGKGLEADTAERVGIPRAIRGLDEVGKTMRRTQAAHDPLTDAARRVVRNATVSGGFYMVEAAVFQELAALVAAK
jgi:hypothetical protein